jgi:hypothetical protein
MLVRASCATRYTVSRASVLSSASFCCLGYALTSLIRNEDSAQPVTQALLLPPR